jgi:peptide/nickel transport system substrate-binding protein
MINSLKKQEFDIIPLPFDKIENITNENNLKVLSVNTPGVVYLGFDFRVNDSYGYPNGKNPTSNINIRKAMYQAINIEEFIEEKNNITNREPITQLITSETFGFNPDIKRLEYNITKAKQLLNETEYSNGFNITLDCPNSNYSLKLCNILVDQLSKININVTLNPLPSNKNLEKLFLKNTSFYITGFSPLTAEGTISLLLHSSNINQGQGIWNYGNYSNIEIDILSEIIQNTSDPNIKQELIQNVLSISMKDVACIPLYSSIAFYGVQNHIDWNPRPSLFIIVEDINIKK